MELSDRVKKRRLELGLTQEELAKRMGYASKVSINKIEMGRPCSQKIIVRLAEALDTSVQYLMGWDDEKPETDPLAEKRKKVVDAVMQLSDEQLSSLLILLKNR